MKTGFVTNVRHFGVALDGVSADHAKACHEAKTVVEKLAMDTNPKLRCEMSDW